MESDFSVIYSQVLILQKNLDFQNSWEGFCNVWEKNLSWRCDSRLFQAFQIWQGEDWSFGQEWTVAFLELHLHLENLKSQAGYQDLVHCFPSGNISWTYSPRDVCSTCSLHEDGDYRSPLPDGVWFGFYIANFLV